MKIAILTANLGNFDTPVDPLDTMIIPSYIELLKFKRYTDENFPPIAGLTPRFQYRIPKLFGWEMLPGYDVYIWLDGTFSMHDEHSLEWLLEKLGDKDIALFKHPQRNSVSEEVNYIEQKLDEGNDYIVSRYKNGLHREQLSLYESDKEFTDNVLYTSTAFIYRNNERVQEMMQQWWYYQSRYFTCDQVTLPYAVKESGVSVSLIEENQYKIPYLTLVSHHK